MPSRIQQQIVVAAAACFSEGGFAGTSTKDIAVRADVNETSLFRLFRDKESLFKAALTHTFTSTVDPARLVAPLESERDFRVAIHRSAKTFYASLTLPLVRLEYVAALERPDLVTTSLKTWVDGYVGPIAARIRSEQRAGIAHRDVSPDGAAFTLNNTVYHAYVLRHLFRYRNQPALRALVDAWLVGVVKSK